MYTNDQTKNGYLVFRDHERTVQVDFRGINNGMRIEETSEIGEITPTEVTEWAGWFFWAANPELTDAPISGGSTPADNTQPDPGVEGTSRFVGESEGSASGEGAQFVTESPRATGSWMQCTACVMTDIGLLPINSKSGEPDIRYQAKQPILEPTTEDDFNLFRPLSQKVPSPGSTGILLQCANQDSYELVFFEINDNGGLIVDHKSDGGFSTNVFAVNPDGTIDTANKHAAALDSIFHVVRDQDNAKVVALNGTKSGKDTTGFLPVLMKFDGVEKGGYLTQEKGGPLHVGTNADRRVLGQNKDGLFWGGVHLDTNASWFFSADKNGRLEFTGENFPQDIEELENVVESKIVFDQQRNTFRIITDVAQDASIAEGVVCWNVVNGEDFSEGQLILPPAPEGVPADPIAIWIDYNLSRAVTFKTAGDGCIFELKFIGEASRNGDPRPLYRVLRCKQDLGREISHFERNIESGGFNYFFVSDDDVNVDPWTTIESRITTSIIGTPKLNVLPVDVTDTYLRSEENYNWLSLANVDRGLDFMGAPICPTPLPGFGVEHFKMESLERVGGESIATYEINKQIQID